MILYGSSFSPFVRKVLVYAAEKGIALEVRQPGPRTSYAPEFLAASPLRKMPALVDGDFQIADSTAIITYLEALQPTPALLPADARARARAIWFEEFADTEMVRVVFKTFFNRIVLPRFQKQPGNEALALEGDGELPPLLDYLETAVPQPGQFLAGGQLSVGDIAVASMFVNYLHAGVPIDAARYPRVVGWVQAIHARPSFAGLIAAEKKVLAA